MRIARTALDSKGALSLSWIQPAFHPPEAANHELSAFRSFQFDCGVVIHGTVQYRPQFVHILQVAHTEPVIWHAAVALGSLHQNDFASCEISDQQLALVHYGKALKLLKSKLLDDQTMPPSIILSSSLLLATFETLHKEFDRVAQHVNGGYDYLCNITERQRDLSISLRSDEILLTFLDTFERLEISSSIFGVKRNRFNHDAFTALSKHLPPAAVFQDTTAAGQAALFCLSAMRHLQYLHDMDSDGYNESELVDLQTRLLLAVERWETAMDHFDLSKASFEDQQRARMLKMYISHTKIYVSVVLDINKQHEMQYDAFIPEFRKILNLAITFFDNGETESCKESSLRYPTFATHIGVLHILWFVTLKCRDPRVRHSALALLKTCDHPERGSWDGRKISVYAERVVEIEEGGGGVTCASDVLDESRLYRAYFEPKRDDGILRCVRRNTDADEAWTKWHEIIEHRLFVYHEQEVQ